MLRALGAPVRELPDALLVAGRADDGGIRAFTGGVVDGANDHRIVMAAAIAATRAAGPVTIRGAEAVAKSYPGFFDDFRKLGGECHVG